MKKGKNSNIFYHTFLFDHGNLFIHCLSGEFFSQQHLQTQRDQVERDIERRMQMQEQGPRHSPQSIAREQVKRSGVTAAPSAALGQRSLSPQQDEMDTQAQGGNVLQVGLQPVLRRQLNQLS